MYYSHKLDLTVAQRKKLLRGHTIQVKHEQMGHGLKVHLTDLQSHNLVKAHRQGKGIRLDFRDEHQIHHNIEHGEGFGQLLHSIRRGFNNLGHTLAPVAKTVGNAVKPYIKPALQQIAKVGVPLLVNGISDAIGQPELGAIATPIVSNIAQNAINKSGLGFKLIPNNKKMMHKHSFIGNSVVIKRKHGGALNPSGY